MKKTLLGAYLNGQRHASTVPVEEQVYGADLDLGIESIDNVTVEAELELITLDASIQQAETIEASLESIHSYLASAKEKGGLNAQGAALTLNLYNSLTAELPDDFREEMPSMESFDADGAALGETEIAMESAGMSLKKLIAAVKSMVEAGLKAVSKFLAQHLTIAGRVEAGGEKILSNLDRIKGDPKESSVKPSGIEYLMAAKKPVKTADIDKLIKYAKGVVKGQKAIRAAFAQYNTAIDAAKGGDLASANSQVHAAKQALEKALIAAYSTSRAMKDTEARNYGLGKTFKEHLVSPELPGDRVIVVSVPEDGSDLLVGWTMVNMGSPVKDAALPALSKGDISKWANYGVSLIGEYRAINEDAEKLAKLMKDILKSGQGAVKVLEKQDGGGEQANDFADAIADLKQLVTLVRVPSVDVSKYLAQVANGCVQYATASAKNLAEKKA